MIIKEHFSTTRFTLEKLLKVVSIVSIVITAMPGSSWSEEVSKEVLQELLENARRYQQSIPSYAYDVEVSFSRNDTYLPPDKQHGKYLLSFRKDGERVDVATKQYSVLNEEYTLSYEKRFFWDGKRLFFSQQPRRPSKGSITAVVWRSGEKRRRILFDQNIGAFLEGRFWHNPHVGDWIDLLKKGEKVFLSDSKEQVNNYSCYVINASTDNGDYKLWIDPESGYNIRRATVVLDNNDLAWGKPLGAQLEEKSPLNFSRIEMEITDVVIKEIEGQHFPIGGTLITHITHADGSTTILKKMVERTNIQWNPDFDALGAFKIDLPNGTRVFMKEYPGIRYVWQNGKIVPAEDMTFEEIDKTVEELKKERQ